MLTGVDRPGIVGVRQLANQEALGLNERSHMSRRKNGPKPKKVAYELITRDSVIGHPMYQLLDELVDQYHEELRHARIALAWCTSWNPDVDGRVTLGKCKKASDLDREVASFDFIILLRQSFWCDTRVTELQRKALLDHELCHAAVKYDANGEPVEDERGRQVYRVRKHDIEEFTCIVDRYGCYTFDLEQMAASFRKQALRAFEPCDACRDNVPGWIATLDAKGRPAMMRCECWTRWAQLRGEAIAEEQQLTAAVMAS